MSTDMNLRIALSKYSNSLINFFMQMFDLAMLAQDTNIQFTIKIVYH